jgi:hypothetical protein
MSESETIKYEASHTEVVAAPIDVLWEALVEKASERATYDAPSLARLRAVCSCAPLSPLPRAQVYHPEKYVSVVSRSEVVRDGGLEADGVERKMWPGAAPHPIHELIKAPENTATRKIVDFILIDHPVVAGNVLNIAEAVDKHTSKLTIVMHWRRRGDAPPDAPAPVADVAAACKGATLLTKQHAEAHQAAKASTAA